MTKTCSVFTSRFRCDTTIYRTCMTTRMFPTLLMALHLLPASLVQLVPGTTTTSPSSAPTTSPPPPPPRLNRNITTQVLQQIERPLNRNITTQVLQQIEEVYYLGSLSCPIWRGEPRLKCSVPGSNRVEYYLTTVADRPNKILLDPNEMKAQMHQVRKGIEKAPDADNNVPHGVLGSLLHRAYPVPKHLQEYDQNGSSSRSKPDAARRRTSPSLYSYAQHPFLSQKRVKVRVGAGIFSVDDVQRYDVELGPVSLDPWEGLEEASKQGTENISQNELEFWIEFEPQRNKIILTPRYLTLPLIIVPSGSTAARLGFTRWLENAKAPSCSSILWGRERDDDAEDVDREQIYTKRCTGSIENEDPTSSRRQQDAAASPSTEATSPTATDSSTSSLSRKNLFDGVSKEQIDRLEQFEIGSCRACSDRGEYMMADRRYPAIGVAELLQDLLSSGAEKIALLETDAQGLDAALVFSLPVAMLRHQIEEIAVECQTEGPWIYEKAREAGGIENDCIAIQSYLENNGFQLTHREFNNCACREWNYKFRNANLSRVDMSSAKIGDEEL
ncbi:unnamed protein product [Amoebophrya sp. A25]|nr:unnamed protein product [Amoebophrya sp. A25]|eukprot:GSA25T00018267001.1